MQDRCPGLRPEVSPACGFVLLQCVRVQLWVRAADAGASARRQPWRCLWRGLDLQMTITRPWRRITLQWSQIGLTEGLTFMMFLFAVFVPWPVPRGIPDRAVTSRPV